MKKTLSVILSLIMLCSMFALGDITAVGTESSGSFGDGFSWNYSEYDNTLQISRLESGQAFMEDFAYSNGSYNRPWEAFVDDIKLVIISDAFSIGDYAFAGCKNLGGIVFYDSTIATIGQGAFQSCENMTSFYLPGEVMAIGPSAFEGCAKLNIVRIGKNVKYIGDNAFKDCPMEYTLYTGTPEQIDFVFFEDATESLSNVIYADTEYDVAVQRGEYQVLTAISAEPFTFRTENKNIASVIEIEYGTLTEDGETYYYGAAAVTGGDDGITTVYAINNNGAKIGAFGVIVGKCAKTHTVMKQYTLKTSTCHEEGIFIYECGHCSHKKTELLSKDSHIVVYNTVREATCQAPGLEKGECVLCKDEIESKTIPQLDHNWTDWEVTVAPTEETEGKKERHCTMCQEKQTEVIPSLSTLMGDVNGDGKVSAIDARMALQCAAGNIELDEHQLKLADVTGDGEITAIDARKILQIAATSV